MALAFDATYYISQRPDVFQAYIATAGKTGLTLAQFAQNHYNTNGRFEGSNPNAIFNTNEYLAANPDVATSGLNPFTHYLQFGAAEGRAPSASFITFAAFDSATYLTANPDLAAAGITTKAQAYTHFVLYGEFENRPGTPTIVAAPGVTLPLTTAVEVKNGTAGNDTFTGVVSSTAGESTIQTGDSIVGKGGTDKLTATLVNNAAVTVVADLTNISVLEARNFAAGVATFQLGSAIGLKEIDTSGTSANSTVATGLKNIVDAKVSDSNGGGLNLQYDNAVIVGSADAQNLAVSSANATFAVNGIETLNVTATGANSAIETNQLVLNTNGSLKALNVTGAGSLFINSFLDASVTTVDASKSTGSVELFVNAASGNQTITGGAGNDIFHLGGTLTATDVITGGAGIDTVIFNSAGDYTLAANAAALAGLNGVKGVEKLQFDAQAGVTTVNNSTLTNADVTTLSFSTAGDDVINNNGTRSVEFAVGNAGAATINLNAGVTTANITLAGTDPLVNVTKDGTAVSVGNLTVALSGTAAAGTTETVSLHSLGDLNTGATNSVGTIALASGSKIVIDGKASLSIAGLTTHATVDASALTTGKLDFHGSHFTGTAGIQDTVTPANNVLASVTENGADTITLAANKLTDTIHFTEITANNGAGVGGLGNDSGILVTSGATAATTTYTGAIYHDVVAGFEVGAGGDVLDINGSVQGYTALAAATQTAINNLSGAGATLKAAADLAATAHTTNDWTAFSFQGATYAYHENTPGGTAFTNGDTIVELTGVSVAGLTTANFA